VTKSTTLIILILLLIVGGVVWYEGGDRRAVQPVSDVVNKPVTDITQDAPQVEEGVGTKQWTTYKSEEWQFEISYPPHWSLVDKNYAPTIPVFVLSSKSGGSVLILPRGELDAGPPPIRSEEQTNINGSRATRTEYELLSDGTQLIKISFQDWYSSNRIEYLTASGKPLEPQLKEFDKILRTFKLLTD
jgi:hypothetical protein